MRRARVAGQLRRLKLTGSEGQGAAEAPGEEQRGWRTRALGSERVCVASFRSCSVGVRMEKWTSGRKESSETPRTPSHLPADVVAPRRRVGRGWRRHRAHGHTVRKRQISGWTRTATTVFEENVEECVLWIMKNFLKTEQNSASHIRKPWKTSLRKNAQPCPAEMLGWQPPWSAPRPAQGAGEAARPVESDGTPEGGSPGTEAPGGQENENSRWASLFLAEMQLKTPNSNNKRRMYLEDTP